MDTGAVRGGDGCHDSRRRNDNAKGLLKRCCCAHLRKADERRGKLRTFGRWADIAHVINDRRALRHAPTCGMCLSLVNGCCWPPVVTGADAGCRCPPVVTGAAAGRRCPLVVSGAAVGYWCPLLVAGADAQAPAFGVQGSMSVVRSLVF